MIHKIYTLHLDQRELELIVESLQQVLAGPVARDDVVRLLEDIDSMEPSSVVEI